MKKQISGVRFSLLALMVLMASVSRLVPHPPNFTPIGAIALFGGAYFLKRWTAFIIPLISLWISDLVISNIVYAQYHDGFVWFYKGFYWNYGSFLLIVFMGILLLKKVKATSVIAASLSASLVFFIISNLGVWYSSLIYPPTFTGLLACYSAGIPFFGNTLMGDAFYSGILFGSFEFAKYKFPVLAHEIKN